MLDRFRLLHLRPMGRHPGRSALVSVAVACGVSLVVAVLVLEQSITSSVGRLNGAAGDVDLVAQGPGDAGLPVAVADRIGAVDGVDVAAPIVRVTGLVDGRDTLVLGVGPEVLGLGLLPEGCADELGRVDADRLGRGVLVGPDLARADQVRLTLPWGSTVVAPVAGRLDCPGASLIGGGRFVVGPLPTVQRLVDRPDRIDAVLVRASGPTTEVTSQVEEVIDGRGVVERPQELVAQAQRMVRTYQQALLVLSALALTTAGFLTFNVVTMSVLERRADLATAWALGLRRPVVVRGVLVETAILAVAGSAIGTGLGVALASGLLDHIPTFVLETIEVAPALHVARNDLVLGGTLGIGSALLAAALPTVQALRASDPAALRPGGAPDMPTPRGAAPRAALLGLVALAAGAGALLFVPSASLLGLGAVIIGIILATFGLAPAMARVAAWLASRLGRPGRVAALVIGRAPRRVWSTVMAIAVAACVIVTAGSMAGDQLGTFDRMWRSLGAVDVWAQTLPAEKQAFGPRLPPEALVRAGAVEGVASVSGGWSMPLVVEGRKIRLDAVLPGSKQPIYHLASPAARDRLDTGTGAVVSSNLATRLGIERGEMLTVPTTDGPRRLEVVEVLNLLNSAEGIVGVPHRWAAAALDRPGFSWLEITLTPGSERARMPGVIRDALSTPEGPPVFAYSGEEFYALGYEVIRRSTTMMTAMQVAIGLTASLAVASTMLMSVHERRRELGVLRAAGLEAPSVRSMLMAEAVAYGAVGLVVGVVLGIIMFRAAGEAVSTMSLVDFDGVLSTTSVWHAAAAVAALVLGVGAVVARIGSAGDIDSAISYE
jgi:putative ABC transport system permease protein